MNDFLEFVSSFPQGVSPGEIERRFNFSRTTLNRRLKNEIERGTLDSTLRGILDKPLKKMREEGYLILANPEREIYEVTGKIEYLQEVVDFVMAYESIPDEVEEEPETGLLL